MGIDLSRYITDKEQEEACEHTREVAPKYGIAVVCEEEEEQENQPTLHLPDDEECHNTKKVASKYGVQIICDENDDAENGKA